MRHHKYDCVSTLREAGISFDDATALRRISMTLHRWHELECGDGNNYGSWCITRGRKEGKTFIHDDDGAPFMEHHHYLHGAGKDTTSYNSIPDNERGALKRLAAIIYRYPGFAFYVQGDPRGCALYILRPSDLEGVEDIHSCYNRGVAVCK